MSQSSTLVKKSAHNKSRRPTGSSQKTKKPLAPAAPVASESGSDALKASNSPSVAKESAKDTDIMPQTSTPTASHSGLTLLLALQNSSPLTIDPISTPLSRQTPRTKEAPKINKSDPPATKSSGRPSPQPQPPPTPAGSPEKGKCIANDDSASRCCTARPPRIINGIAFNQVLRHLGQKPLPLPEELPAAIEDIARQISKNEFPEVEAHKASLQIPTPPPSPPTAQVVATSKEEDEKMAPSASTSRPNIPFITLDRTISEAAVVRFGDGLAVQMITLPSDSTRVVVSGISSDVTLSELGWYLGSYGTVAHKELIPGPSGGTAHIRFMHHQQALTAVEKLDGEPGLATTTHLTARLDTSIAPNLTATNLLTDTIILRWSPPRPRLRLYYREPRVARQEAEVINRRPFEGQRLRAWQSNDRHVVFVEGLSLDADLQEIIRRHGPDLRPFFLDHYKHDEVMKQIDALVKASTGLQNQRLKETADSVTVTAQFHTSEEAEAFFRNVSSMELSWSRAAKLSIIHARDLVYVLSADKYYTIKGQVDGLKTRLAEAGIQLWVLKPSDYPHYRHIRIRGGHYVKDHKPLIDDILNGQIVMRGDKPFWDADLELIHGTEIFTNFDISGVQIIADTKQKRITVFGLEEDRAHAIQCILRRASVEQKRLSYHLFPRWQLPYWDVEGGGGGTLIRELGRKKVFIDPRTCRIIVAGERAQNLLETMKQKSPKKQHQDKPKANRSQCPVCLEEPIHGILLNCGHTYCKTCFIRYVVSTSQYNASFPLQCFASNNSCNTSIPLRTIKKLLSDDELQLAMTRSFTTHIDSHPQEFRHCPTSDCPQLIRVRQKSDSVQPSHHCSSCLYKTCPSCFVDGGHDGKTCSQYEAWQAEREAERGKEVEEWIKSIGGRVCPKCKTGLVKDGGCAHVQCSRCKVHICWTCGKPFEEVGEESVYEHMRREHGSIGLIDWEVNDSVDIPRYDIEYDAPKILPPPAPRSQSLQASTPSSSGKTSRPSNARPRPRQDQNRKRKPWRRPQYYSDYGRDELSEDENDEFGNGEWDYDFTDLNWEAL